MTTDFPGWVKVFDQSRTRVPVSQHKAMYDAGFRVMAGYDGGGSPDKRTLMFEIDSWLSQGVDTGFAALFEIAGTEPIDAPSSGLAHAQRARAAWRAQGYPDSRSIAVAVDENVTVAEARAQLTQYFTLWKTWDTVPPLAYVEMDAGAILFAEGIIAGTFTPAAYSWDPSNTLVTPQNAPAHVMWTQEHNGQNLDGGNVDIGHIRETANIQWRDGRMTTIADEVWNDDIIANPTQRTDHATNPTTKAGFALGDAWQQIYNLANKLGILQTTVSTLVSDVAKIPTTAVPAAPLSDADIQRIATELANQLRGTL